jgi:hypothetical protein
MMVLVFASSLKVEKWSQAHVSPCHQRSGREEACHSANLRRLKMTDLERANGMFEADVRGPGMVERSKTLNCNNADCDLLLHATVTRRDVTLRRVNLFLFSIMYYGLHM